MATAGGVNVWSLALRLFHWLLTVGFFLAYLTPFAPSGQAVHRWTGYLIFGLLCVRLVWGFTGSRFTRFSDMLYGPLTVLRYLWRMLTGRIEPYLGHSPAAGSTAILLIVCLLLTIWSGVLLDGAASRSGPLAWLMQATSHSGIAGLITLHGIAAWLCLVLVIVHIVIAFWESVLQRENLFLAMITGRKRARNRIPPPVPANGAGSNAIQIPGYDVWVDPAAIAKVDLGRSASGRPQVKLMLHNETPPRVYLFSERRQALKFYQTIWALKNNYYATAALDQ